MRFDKYLNNRSQVITLAIHQTGFGYLRDAELKAAHFLHNAASALLAIFMIPKVFIDYFAVNVGLRAVPAPVLEMMQAQHAQMENGRKTKAARKVGFQPPAAPGTALQ